MVSLPTKLISSNKRSIARVCPSLVMRLVNCKVYLLNHIHTTEREGGRGEEEEEEERERERERIVWKS